MTTIVKHRKTGNEYILLGINQGGGKINLPSRFLNDLFTPEESANSTSVTVCDARGNIFIVYIDDLIVVEIDGQKPAEILPEIVTSTVDDDFEEEEDFESGDRPAAQATSTVNTDSKLPDNDDFDDEDEDWI